MSSVSSDVSVEIGSLSGPETAIPPFTDMCYFEIEFVVWEGCRTIFNKCLLSVQSTVVGTGNTKKYEAISSASEDPLLNVWKGRACVRF